MAAPLLSASSSMNAETVSLSSFQAEENIMRPCSIHWLRYGTFEGAKGLMHEPWSQKNEHRAALSFEREHLFPHRVEPFPQGVYQQTSSGGLAQEVRSTIGDAVS